MRTIEGTDFFPFLQMARINAMMGSTEPDSVKLRACIKAIADDLDRAMRGIEGTQDEALLDLQAALEGKDD